MCVGMAVRGEESDGEGSTDATGAFCGLRMSRCGLRAEVCASLFSKKIVGYGLVGPRCSIRRPCVTVPLASWLTVPVNCCAEAEGMVG